MFLGVDGYEVMMVRLCLEFSVMTKFDPRLPDIAQ